MVKYYVLKGREMVLKSDGEQELDVQDLDLIAQEGVVVERFSEASNEIEVLNLQDLEHLPAGYVRLPIRAYIAAHSAEDVGQVSRAKALLEWRQNTRFCGRCGARLKDDEKQTARVCPDCGQIIFPRIEPCVIVLVHREGKILLAKHVQRNQDIYACIAGFVEAGETIEQAVEREIMEETHIRVKNIRYFGSQSWPFPSQLMLAFNADYDGGDINLQVEEIADAQWFDPEHCPASPKPGSIAYRLIEASKRQK